jgi:hypothetical protein
MRFHLTSLFCVAFAVAIIAARPASAQSAAMGDEDVLSELAAAHDLLTSEGYEQTYDNTINKLPNQGTMAFTVTLHKGTEYYLTAACDRDCTDIDLKLIDSTDTVVAQDVDTDDTPLVRFTPSHTGEYKLKVMMAECSDEPCYFGIAVYGKH